VWTIRWLRAAHRRQRDARCWRRGAREDRLHREIAELAIPESEDPQERFV
jgi:hypothetical protein